MESSQFTVEGRLNSTLLFMLIPDVVHSFRTKQKNLQLEEKKQDKESGEDYTKKNSEFAYTKCYWPYQLMDNGIAGNIKKTKEQKFMHIISRKI